MLGMIYLNENIVSVDKATSLKLKKRQQDGALAPITLISQKNMPLLCKALILATELPERMPVYLTTSNVFRLPELSKFAQAWFYTQNDGWIYFPSIRLFRQCAMDAIRDHDPHAGDITLQNCWQQAV
ncbi:hypothetical protein INF70_21785, partial [Enterobacter cloacae complex sp. P4RS]